MQMSLCKDRLQLETMRSSTLLALCEVTQPLDKRDTCSPSSYHHNLVRIQWFLATKPMIGL